MNDRASKPRPVVLITGASAGIGAALARVFAGHGHDLVLIARREAKLDTLADEIAAAGHVRPLVLSVDLTGPGGVERIASQLAAHGLEPQFIVNNAGFGLIGEAAELDRAEQLAMIDLNVRVLTELSLAYIDTLSRLNGGILNVASVAGYLPGPGMAVYYATKAYVLSFTEALYQELRPKGVRVTVLCPGPVPTEFQARAGIPEVELANGQRAPRALGSNSLLRTPDEVAAAGYAGLMRGRRVVIPGIGNRAMALMARLTPHWMMLGIVARAQATRRNGADGGPNKVVREAP
jgi:short-subunit dehydrogenase